MKKLQLLGMAAFIAFAVVSCGSEKQMANNQPQQRQSNVSSNGNTSNDSDWDKKNADLDKEIEYTKKKQELERLKKNTSIDPCGEYYDDDDFMRDYGIATHSNQGSAQAASIDAAKENLRKHMAEFVQGLTKSYRNLYAGSKNTDDIERKIEGNFNAAVQGMLDRARKICQKHDDKDNEGNWTYYAAFEIPVKEIKKAAVQSMNKLSDNEKIALDYHQDRFEKQYDEEYEKMLEAQKNAGY